MLNEAHGDSCVSRATVFEWHKQFMERRENDPKTKTPSTSKTNDNIEKICQLVYSDHQLIICIMADKLGIAKETKKNKSLY